MPSHHACRQRRRRHVREGDIRKIRWLCLPRWTPPFRHTAPCRRPGSPAPIRRTPESPSRYRTTAPHGRPAPRPRQEAGVDQFGRVLRKQHRSGEQRAESHGRRQSVVSGGVLAGHGSAHDVSAPSRACRHRERHPAVRRGPQGRLHPGDGHGRITRRHPRPRSGCHRRSEHDARSRSDSVSERSMRAERRRAENPYAARACACLPRPSPGRRPAEPPLGCRSEAGGGSAAEAGSCADRIELICGSQVFHDSIRPPLHGLDFSFQTRSMESAVGFHGRKTAMATAMISDAETVT